MPQEIRENFPNIRIEEIPIAIKRGTRKEYGDYFGLNVISFSGFLKSYLESEDRKRAAIDFSKKNIEDKKIPSSEEILSMENKMIINAYSKFLETGYYDDFGNHVY